MGRWGLILTTLLVIVLAIVATRFIVSNTGYLFPYIVTVYNYNDSGKSVYLNINDTTVSKLNYGSSTSIKVRNNDVLSTFHEKGETPLQYTFYSSFLSVLNSVYIFGDSIQSINNVVNLKITNSTTTDLYIFIVETSTEGFPSPTPIVKSTDTITIPTYVGRELGFSTSSSYDDVVYNYIITLTDKGENGIIITNSGISTE